MGEKLRVPLADPRPDFEELKRVLSGRKKASRVHFAELYSDREIVAGVLSEYLGENPVPTPLDNPEKYYRQLIKFWSCMGYDYIRIAGGLDFPGPARLADDTAALSRGTRQWAEEGIGAIRSWDDFERYPWPRLESAEFFAYELVARLLPPGMQMMVCPSSGVFEVVSEFLLGFEGLSYLLYEAPDLVEAVFSRVGELILKFYEQIVTMDGVGGFFQGDDMGFKTSTFLSPAHLAKYVLPWHAKYAALAHAHGKVYWLHSCGNLKSILGALVDDVQIDAMHSFQDEILPVSEFAAQYGSRVAVLGGVDMDQLCRLDEDSLRRYVRRILESCASGRYALGSGNTVANFVPLPNYLVMLDEGMRWAARNS